MNIQIKHQENHIPKDSKLSLYFKVNYGKQCVIVKYEALPDIDYGRVQKAYFLLLSFWEWNLHNKEAIKFALKGEIIACWQIITIIPKFIIISYEIHCRAVIATYNWCNKNVGVILNEIMIRYIF